MATAKALAQGTYVGSLRQLLDLSSSSGIRDERVKTACQRGSHFVLGGCREACNRRCDHHMCKFHCRDRGALGICEEQNPKIKDIACSTLV